MTWIAIPLAGGTVISTMLGGLFALRLQGQIGTLIAASGGVVVGVALFDVLPEAFDNLGNAQHVAWLVGVGFLVFFVAARALVLHHRDDDEHVHAHARVGAMGAAALSVHSFLDGLGIGFAFHVSNATGFIVFLAVVSHDFADGLNTVSFVLRQSVPWVVFLSVYAIIATHWAGWSAERPNEVEDTGQRDKRQPAFGNLNSTNVQAETHPAE